MGGRKQKTREQQSGVFIIGEGITEQYYFSHIKQLMNCCCTIKPRFFGNTSISEIKKQIDRILQGDVCVICVFDADVAEREEHQREELQHLLEEHKNNPNVLFCLSLPSIEYWFLLHYENTNRQFTNAKAAEKALTKHLPAYKKTKGFLEKKKWVIDLCSDGKLHQAIERAATFKKGKGSYTNVWEAIKLIDAHDDNR